MIEKKLFLVWENAPAGFPARFDLPSNGGTLIVGRSSRADIVIDDPTVSRSHVMIEVSSDGSCLHVVDLSGRGFYHGGNRMSEVRLPISDSVSIGEAVIRFASLLPAEETSAARSIQPLEERAQPQRSAQAPSATERLTWECEALPTPEEEAYLAALIDSLWQRLNRKEGSKSDSQQLRDLVKVECESLIRERRLPPGCDRNRMLRFIMNEVLGYGPIEPFIEDPGVTEIMVVGRSMVYVERGGRIYETNARFRSDQQLLNVIERIVAPIGRRIDESSPMVDARLPDGSRVNAVIPPIALDGPLLTIRKFRKEGFTVEDLIQRGAFTHEMAEFFRACVRGRLNIIISGGTGSGKTTLLNTLSSFISADERIVTIEDSAELRLTQKHKARLEARPPNIEGKGRISIRDLVINALRMRPDRIIVGECRGGEALDMVQAMNTGHDGSLTTLHANSPRDALSRLEVMCLMAGMDLPMRAIREQIASAVQLIIQVERGRDGRRRVTNVTELIGLQQDVYTLQDIFIYDPLANTPQGASGRHTPTGMVPTFLDALKVRGQELPLSIFQSK